MTDAPPPPPSPRPRRGIRRKLTWGFLILCGAAAAWTYEVNAFDIAARADGNRRNLYVHSWPQEAYAPTLERARDPRAAEELMPDEDSVSYFLTPGPHGPVLRQVFHVTLRHGPRRWHRRMSVVWDQRTGPLLKGTEAKDGFGEPLERDKALAWYDGWLARERAWRSDNAERLELLILTLAFHGGTLSDRGSWWSIDPDSLQQYDAHLASIHRFGEAGIEALVDCLGDAKTTTTRAVVREVDRGPVRMGVLCYYILREMVKFDGTLSQEDYRDFVNTDGRPDRRWAGALELVEDSASLAEAEAVWRKQMATGEYSFVRPPEY